MDLDILSLLYALVDLFAGKAHHPQQMLILLNGIVENLDVKRLGHQLLLDRLCQLADASDVLVDFILLR